MTARDMWRGAAALQEQSDYRCQVEPLAPAYSDQMLNALVRPGRGTTALIREILKRTRGNPLFIEETLNVLHEMGALVREGSVYALTRPGVDVPLSPTVRGLLAARMIGWKICTRMFSRPLPSLARAPRARFCNRFSASTGALSRQRMTG